MMLFGSFVIVLLSMLLFCREMLSEKRRPRTCQQFSVAPCFPLLCISLSAYVRSSVDPVAMCVAAVSLWVVILAVKLAVLVQFCFCFLLLLPVSCKLLVDVAPAGAFPVKPAVVWCGCCARVVVRMFVCVCVYACVYTGCLSILDRTQTANAND